MKTLLTFFLLISVAVIGQQTEPLGLNKKSSHQIAQGQKHTYKLNLKASQFSIVIVNQDGIDLLIVAKDPKGNEIGSFDSPNGKHGPEVISFVSDVAGTYMLEVSPLNEEETAGKYTIELTKSEPKGTTPEQQIDQLMSAVIKPGSAGASVAVAKGDKVLFSKGYGSANPEYDIPITPKTVFHIASISKQFTAFAIAMLADQGKLSLDDDIRKHLPELNDFGKKITIKHLVFHTSGLRDQWNLLALAGWRLDDVITKNQVLRLISHQKELNEPPGTEFNYCNTGYTLMAEIVSRVSGMSFAQWCAENIFKPLGMTNTLFYDDHEMIVKNRAYSFQDSPGGLKKSVLSYANAGATSLFTTAEDLMKWSANFQTMKVGNSKVMKQMEERGVLNKGDTLTYTFGQGIGTHKGLKVLSHGGADAGYRSFLVRFPEQQYSIAILSNLGSFNPGKIAFDIADIYLKPFYKEEAKKPEVARQDTKEVQVSEELLKLYSGQYEMQTGMVVNFRVENGKLVGQPVGQPPLTLEARSENEFFISAIGATITFEKGDDNTVKQLVFTQGTQKLVASRMKPFDPSAVDPSKYVGDYYSPELQTMYSVVVEDKKIIARHIRHEPVELKPTSTNVFSTDAWFMGKIEFVPNAQGVITGMKVSSGRVKNVRFDKK